jgi:hypothetical protein
VALWSLAALIFQVSLSELAPVFGLPRFRRADPSTALDKRIG